MNVQTRDKIISEYYNGADVLELCGKYNCKRRTVYYWIERYGHGARTFNPKNARRKLLLTLNETELILMMILECESILKKTDLPTVMALENRLLNIADELTEIKNLVPQ